MRNHISRLAIGVGSGAAAATLFFAAMRGAPLGVALAYLGPLPLMIATLGWGYDAGLVGLFVACGLAASVAPTDAIVYGLLVALPAWALAAFVSFPALYARKPADPATTPRVYPGPGAAAVLAAAIFAAAGAAQLMLMGFGKGGYAGAVADLGADLRDALDASSAARALFPDMTPDQLAQAIVAYAPAAVSTGATLCHLANLYLAARSVQLSQRLARPWRDIPSGFVLPRWLAAPMAVSLALAFAPTPGDAYGLVAAGPLGALYALQGLATLHSLSRRAAARPFMLAALYFALAVATQWVAPALAVLGLAESFADLRGRAARNVSART